MTAERRGELVEPLRASPGRTAALMLVLSATLVAAIVSWLLNVPGGGYRLPA